MSAVLSVEDLSVSYGRRRALDGIRLEAERGSVFALLGRNGAGKSSLVRCLLGLQKPQGGRVLLFGEDAWSKRDRVLARVGVVPEEPDAPPEMTARELIAFCGALYPTWSDEEAEERLRRLEVPLELAFGHLSKGQKGAVMLALALASQPELLVLDDPTLGLDVVARRALYDELIGELADRGTTVFVTTHDLAGIEALADRVAVLHDARLAVDEPMDSLKERFRRLRCAPGGSWEPFAPATAVEREWGREAVVTNFSEERLAEFAARSGGDVGVGAVALEDIFLAVAGAGGRS